MQLAARVQPVARTGSRLDGQARSRPCRPQPRVPAADRADAGGLGPARTATDMLARGFRSAGVAEGRSMVHDRYAWMVDDQEGRIVGATSVDPIDQGSGIMRRPKFRMWVRPDGIVQLVWAPRATIAIDDAIAATEAMAELTGGRRSRLLVVAYDVGPQDRAARMEFARRGDLVSGVALIVSTPLSRVLADFYMSAVRQVPPTRLFGDEASALDWLQGLAE